MILHRLARLAAFASGLAVAAGLALAPAAALAQAATWSYSAPGNVSTADYPGNVVVHGTCTGCGSSSGTVTTSGSPTAGQIAQFSSPTAITTGPATGTSGHTLPFLDGVNTWSGAQSFTVFPAPAGNVATDAGAAAGMFRDVFIGGHIATAGSTSVPTVTGCGTSPSVNAGSSDSAGKIIMGSGTPSACTLTFARAYSVNIFCMFQDQTAPNGISSIVQSLTAPTVNFAASSPGHNVVYICHGT